MTYVLLILLLIPFLFPLADAAVFAQELNTAYPPVCLRADARELPRGVPEEPFFTFTVNSLVVALARRGSPCSWASRRLRHRPLQRTGIALAILTAHGAGHRIPDPLVHPVHEGEDDRHLHGAHPDPPSWRCRWYWVMIVLRGRAGRPDEASRIDGVQLALCESPSSRQAGIVATGILASSSVEQPPLLAHHRGLQDAHPADRRLQLPAVRSTGGPTAAATVITLPVLVPALLVQKHIVRRFTPGALKG